MGRREPGLRVALEPFEVRQEIARRLVAHAAVLLEQLVEDELEGVRQIRIDPYRRGRDRGQDLVEHDAGRRPPERLVPGRHLVQHDAEREEIRAGVELLAPHLLGRHVGHRADRPPRAGQLMGRLYGGHSGLELRLLLRQLREPEIQDLRVATRSDEDVRRLDVAMDDPRTVRRVEGVGDLDRQAPDSLERHRLPADLVLEGLPFQELHDEERAPVRLAEIVDRTNVRVVERRGRTRLTLEPLERFLTAGELLGQELERDNPPEALVLGLVDEAHAAAPELFEDPVVRERFADHTQHLSRPPRRGIRGIASILHATPQVRAAVRSRGDRGGKATSLPRPSGRASCRSSPASPT